MCSSELETTSRRPSSSSSPSGLLQTITEFRETSSSISPDKKKQRRWQVLVFGQTIAIAAASVNASSYTLQYILQIVLPIFQMSIMYIFLSCFLSCRNTVPPASNDYSAESADTTTQTPSQFYTLPILKLKLRIPWWIYFCMSVIDVEANYMVLLSLRFTSLTSTTLLGSLTVPSVMVCSRYILGRFFFIPHYIGVLLCLMGGTLMVWSDLGATNTSISRNSQAYIGDLLAISAALLYGLGDTVAEYAIKHIDRAEYLGMLGLFGFVISSIQFCILERDNFVELLLHTPSSRQRLAVATMVWYIASLIFYYVAASYFLTRSDATLLNLSLQTTSLWACVFALVANGTVPPLVFFLAVVLVTSGVCVYEVLGGNAVLEEQAKEEDRRDEESESLVCNGGGASHHSEPIESYMSI